MTIGTAIHNVVDKLTPGHKTTPGSTAPHTTNTTTNAYQTGTTSSASPAGTMEQAGAGEYSTHSTGVTGTTATTHAATTEYGHVAGAVGGGLGHHGNVAATPAAGDMVCVPGNVAAPVPVGEKKFIVTEDHAVQKQRVERWVEHQPVEREFVTRVEETGVVSAGATVAEGAAGAERVVNEHTCYPTSTTTIHGVAGQSAGVESNRIV